MGSWTIASCGRTRTRPGTTHPHSPHVWPCGGKGARGVPGDPRGRALHSRQPEDPETHTSNGHSRSAPAPPPGRVPCTSVRSCRRRRTAIGRRRTTRGRPGRQRQPHACSNGEGWSFRRGWWPSFFQLRATPPRSLWRRPCDGSTIFPNGALVGREVLWPRHASGGGYLGPHETRTRTAHVERHAPRQPAPQGRHVGSPHARARARGERQHAHSGACGVQLAGRDAQGLGRLEGIRASLARARAAADRRWLSRCE